MAVSTPASSYLGTRIPRVDGPEKVTGQARYGDDLAALRPAPRPARARPATPTRGSRASTPARRSPFPASIAVVTADDLAAVLKSPPTSRSREMLARGETRFCGQPVAAVLAESEAAAEDALALVEVEYEELPAVLDPLDALRADAPAVWPDGVPGRKEPTNASDPSLQSPNLADHVAVRPWRRRGRLRRGRRRGRALLPHLDRPPELPGAAHLHGR